jgi:hypothetical protein
MCSYPMFGRGQTPDLSGRKSPAPAQKPLARAKVGRRVLQRKLPGRELGRGRYARGRVLAAPGEQGRR